MDELQEKTGVRKVSVTLFRILLLRPNSGGVFGRLDGWINGQMEVLKV